MQASTRRASKNSTDGVPRGSGWHATLLRVPSNSVTFGLAVVGASAGLASAATQVYAATTDRPRLRTNFGITTRADGRPTIFLEVTNVGRRATTVRQFGFYGGQRRVEITRKQESKPWASATADITFHEGPTFLEAGQSHRVDLVPNIDTFGIHADYPFRAYAMDINGRRIWGGAAPVVRMLFGPNPPLTDADPPELKALFSEPRGVLRPAQVEPRWKLWKRRELREPKAWRSTP
jgi:hypothetical protein